MPHEDIPPLLGDTGPSDGLGPFQFLEGLGLLPQGDQAGDGAAPDAPGPGEPTSRSRNIGNGVVVVEEWDGVSWGITAVRSAPTGGGGAAGPTSAELAIDQRRNDLIQRQQDIDVQIADADRQLDALALQLQSARDEVDREVSLGHLDLARTAEARVREFEQKRIQLDRDRLALDQQRLAVNSQIDAASVLGTIGADLGNLEFQRDELLLDTLANPRDFAELALQQGGGHDFLDQLLGNEPVTGRSSRLIGERTLGPAFEEALASIMQRPELDFFAQAGERLGGIPGFDELQAPLQPAAPTAAVPTAAPPLANVRDAQLAAQQGDVASAEEIARRVLQGV